MTTCVLGIDIGSTGARAAVLRSDGRLLGRARRAHAVRVAPGRAEHDPGAWLAGAIAAGREAVDESGGVEIAAVGVAALGPAPVLVDGDLTPLTPAPLFSLDRRAETQRLRLTAELGLADAELTHDHAVPKLLWWRENAPEIWERSAWALDATGFVVSTLVGHPTMDSITVADYTLPGLSPPVPVPDPLDPLALAGELTAGPARELGIPAGTPVAVGTYDTYADVAGAGVRRPGNACILLGSTLVVCRVVSAAVECPGLEVSSYPGEGLLLGGWTTAAGSSLAWFERELGDGRPDGGLARAAAALEPGAGGLLALPYLAGERTPVRDPHARGLVLGLTLSTRREEVYRALVDAVALSARDHAVLLDQVGESPDYWLVSGGGTRNPAWLEATASALGSPLAIAAHAGEAVGPADLALRAIGVESERPCSGWVDPDPRREERFARLFALYRELYPVLARPMRRLGDLDAAQGEGGG